MNVSREVGGVTSKNNTPVSLSQGYVTAVYPASMMVDVYIPSTSTIMYGVSLSSSTISKDSRMIQMPKKNSPIIVCTTSSGSTPISLGAYYTPSSETTNPNGINEIVYPGENEMRGGLSYMKQTRDGDMIQNSKIATGTSFLHSGKTYINCLEKHETALNFDAQDGFSLQDIETSTNNLYTQSKKTYHSELTKPCATYTVAELTDNRMTEVIDAASATISLIRGGGETKGYSERVVALQDIFKSYNATTAETKITAIEALLNQYIIFATGPKVKLDFGFVSNESSNIPTTPVQSSEGYNAVARMQIIPSSGTTGSILIDTEKNINMVNIGDFLLNGVQIATLTEINTINAKLAIVATALGIEL